MKHLHVQKIETADAITIPQFDLNSLANIITKVYCFFIEEI